MADNLNNSENLSLVKALEQAMKNAIKAQGDYNNIVSDSVNGLKKLGRELEKQADYIDDIVDSDRSREVLLSKIQKAQEKQALAQKRSGDLAKNLSEIERINATSLVQNIEKKRALEQNYQSILRSGNQQEIKNADSMLSYLEQQIGLQEESLNVSELEYAAAVQMEKSRSKAVDDLKEQESLAGKLERKMAGVNNALGTAGKIGKGFSSFDSFTDMIGSIPGFGTIVSGLVKGFASLLQFILEIDDKIIKFGRNLGYSKDQSYEIYTNFTRIQESSGKLLTTTANLMEVQTDLSQQLGVNNILTAEMLETQIELKKIMGLSTDEMGSLAQASIVAGKSQKEVVTGVLAQVEGLKKATGISFNYKQIIGEATKLGGVLGLQFAKYPEKLTKSLVITKALGMDLAKVDQIAGSLLDFETSIQDQLEAQLITGKDINLSRAQLLALEGDTAGVAMEISKQFGSANEFLKMNRIQQESIAKAVGMSREDLADTLKNQEMLTKLGAKDTDNAQKRLQLALSKYKTEKEINAALGEGAYQNLTQLSAQEKIAELIEKVKSSIQGFLVNSGIVEYITDAIDYISNPDRVKSLISTLREGAAMVADVVQKIAYGLLKLVDYIPGVDTGDLIKQLDEVGSVGDRIRGTSKGGSNIVRGEAQMQDFVIKPLPQDTIASNGVTVQGGTRLGRTDEMVDLLKQILSETKQGKVMSLSIDGAPVATAVARNASLNPAASSLGPRPLR